MWAGFKRFDQGWLRGFDYVTLTSRWKSKQDVSGAVAHRQAGADLIVADLVARSAVRAELAVAICRLAFVSLVLVRFLSIAENWSRPGLARAMIEVPVLTATVLILLVFIVVALRWPEHVVKLIHASVLLDILACSATLLPGVLYPWQAYRGLLRSPDVAMVLVLCVSSGLRFSLSAAWLSAFANAACVSGLIALDLARNAALVEYGAGDLALYAIYYAGATSLGVTLATRGNRLAEQAARFAMLAAAAREGLIQALRDSHDAASLLSAAQIQADLLRQRAEASPLTREGPALGALCNALGQLANLVNQSRRHADSGVTATEPRELVDVGATIELAIQRAAHRFPAVRFEAWRGELELGVVGGARAFTSILFNLLINACEGDGVRGATTVVVDVREAPCRLVLTVSDDGPGFAASQLTDVTRSSTKPNGAGVGIYIVRRMLAANGGEVSWNNGERGGALVSVVIPRLTPLAVES